MNAKVFIDEALDAGLEAVFEAVFAGGDTIIQSTAGQILVGEKYGVHLRMGGEVILHGALGEGHFGFIGALNEAIVAKRNNAFVLIYDYTAHFAGWVLTFKRSRFGDF